MKLSRIILVLALASPPYLVAMHYAEKTYDPNYRRLSMPGRTNESLMLKRPFAQLLDSHFGVVAVDQYFRLDADIIGQERSDILLYEDGKLLGPGHAPHYHVAVLGLGRYAHWKGDNKDMRPVFVFSSSDNTDPNTNGRTYWAERPRAKEKQ